MLKPNLEKTVHKKQDVQKRAHDKAALNRNFHGEAVYVRNYSSGPTWLSGKIVKLIGPVSVEVELEDGSKVQCHFDQIRCKLSTTTGLPERVPLTDHPVVTDESDDYLFMSMPSPDQNVSMENNS